MLNVQILTKNNEKTIKKTLESILKYNNNVKFLIGDYGSVDNTIKICKNYNSYIEIFKGLPRNEARQRLADKFNDNYTLWIEPWEILLNKININNKKNNYYVKILNNNIINFQIRIWKEKVKFVNPIFENIKEEDALVSNIIIGSNGGHHDNDSINILNKWKEKDPTNPIPYYYHSCILLYENKLEDFLKISNHYLFLDNKQKMSTTMTRYYQALVQMKKRGLVQSALKNLNLCMCHKPLMAEFWCLTGDIHYHILNNFNEAKEFYENAIILGKQRLGDDIWPMDIFKYEKYPKKMIKSCNEILEKNSNYFPIN